MNVGPGKEHLQQNIERLYWVGVEQELENIIRTLNTWQNIKNCDASLEDETIGNIHGYDTFLGQVSQEEREFAVQYGKLIMFFRI